MRAFAWTLTFAALGLGGAYGVFLWKFSPEGKPQPVYHETKVVNPCNVRPANPAFLSSQSCASTACHGAVNPASSGQSILRNEYHTWFDDDPHAHALRVLGNAVSRRMVEHLAGSEPGGKTYQKIYAALFRMP